MKTIGQIFETVLIFFILILAAPLGVLFYLGWLVLTTTQNNKPTKEKPVRYTEILLDDCDKVVIKESNKHGIN